MPNKSHWLHALLAPYRFRILLGAFLVALTVLANIGLLGTASVLLARAALLTPLMLLAPVVTGVRFFGTIRAVLRYAERLYNHSVAFRILSGLRQRVYEALEPLVPDRLRDYTEAKLYARLISDVETLQFFYLRVVSMPLGTLLVILCTAGILWPLAPKATFALLLLQGVAALLVPALLIGSTRHLRSERRRAREGMMASLTDLVHGLQVLKASPRGRAMAARLQARAEQEISLEAQLAFRQWAAERAIFALGHITFFLCLALAALEVEAGRLAGIYLSMVAVVALASFETLEQLPQAVNELRASLQAAKDMDEILAGKTEAREGALAPAPLRRLRIEQLSFRYRPTQPPFFDDLNMEIDAGTRVAFVGRSGSGKSTLAKLLLKLWQPDVGALYWNDTPYRELDGEALRKEIVMLEQSPAFFHTSVRDNLRLAAPDATDERLWAVLEEVQLAERIRAFSEGLDASLGENGSRLSGGERQRLAMARLLLADGSVVILDEPLQNLDGITARMLERLLDERMADRTVLLITHSLHQLPEVDFIFLFDRGKLVGRGPHEELLAHNAIYRTLWAMEQERLQEA